MSFPEGFEHIEGTGLWVHRAMIDPQLAGDLASECHDLWERGLGYQNTTAPDSPADVMTAHYRILQVFAYPAVQRVLGMFLGDELDCNIAVNGQQPFAAQVFHGDPKANPVVTVYPEGVGALDYVAKTVAELSPDWSVEVQDDDGTPGTVPVIPEGQYQTLTVHTGDVVVQANPWYVHRGRNLSDEFRTTFPIYTS